MLLLSLAVGCIHEELLTITPQPHQFESDGTAHTESDGTAHTAAAWLRTQHFLEVNTPYIYELAVRPHFVLSLHLDSYQQQNIRFQPRAVPPMPCVGGVPQHI